MKKLLLLYIFLIYGFGNAQEIEVENTPKQLVINFFEAFHARDTIKLKSFASEELHLTSVSQDTAGITKINAYDYSEFLKNIAAIPVEANFEEKLHDFKVDENGILATVTTPYSFYYNGNFSHCGVNTFQLVKFKEEWKIVYLIDTRKKEGCN